MVFFINYNNFLIDHSQYSYNDSVFNIIEAQTFGFFINQLFLEMKISLYLLVLVFE
jgi:hypothetical protein